MRCDAQVAITFPLASLIVEDVFKTEFDSAKILFNYFNSVLSSSPTLVSIQSPAATASALAAGEPSPLDKCESLPPPSPLFLGRGRAGFVLFSLSCRAPSQID